MVWVLVLVLLFISIVILSSLFGFFVVVFFFVKWGWRGCCFIVMTKLFIIIIVRI